jgi:benzaldehyde dehydrogenase (NAD)
VTDRICLLAPAAAWPGHIHAAYGWTPGGDRESPAVEKATGKELATVGRASVEDVGMSARRGRDAQHEWAAVSYGRRAAVLREAGRL